MDILDELAGKAKATVQRGYYDSHGAKPVPQSPSLAKAITSKPRAVLAELKPASPSRGPLRTPEKDLSAALAKGGARGLSVLTEPEVFLGSLGALREASQLGVPTLMKDFVLAETQLACAKRCGASAVLLIVTLHTRRHSEFTLDEMVTLAHDHGLETLVEVASAKEFRQAQDTAADLIGINNRDLRTMELDLRRTPTILEMVQKDRPVVGLSGVDTREHADLLFSAGCDAILVGTSIMKAKDPVAQLEALL